MATKLRPELSIKNKYHIDKHRHYELKHFCLQYPSWKRTYMTCDNNSVRTTSLISTPGGQYLGDPTSQRAMARARLIERIELIEKVAKEADANLHDYILKAVTEGLSYAYLKSRLDIPCGKDMYYDRYRKFFWLLNKVRD